MQVFTLIVWEANKHPSMRLANTIHEPQQAVISSKGEYKMINENQEYRHPANNTLSVVLGMLIGGLAGAVTMLLLAPQSGKDTRMQIQEKGIELRGRTTEMVEDTMAQIRSNANKISAGGREKAKELLQKGEELVIDQLDHVSEAAKAGKKAIQNS
jgi:gas vesicle protein